MYRYVAKSSLFPLKVGKSRCDKYGLSLSSEWSFFQDGLSQAWESQLPEFQFQFRQFSLHRSFQLDQGSVACDRSSTSRSGWETEATGVEGRCWAIPISCSELSNRSSSLFSASMDKLMSGGGACTVGVDCGGCCDDAACC